MIKIGISACFEYPSKTRLVFAPKMLSYVECDMMRYIAKKGVLPVMIPDVDEDLQIDIMKEMDGFLFQGGTDLAPKTYGEELIGKWKGDRYRDEYELKILDFAIQNNKPVLGICRGFQLMNVYFGGSLYQDTATQNAEASNHRDADLYDRIKHSIEFVQGGYLAALYRDEKKPYVNSVHHQAIKQLGKNLDVYALSADGLIEAFGYNLEPAGKVMGVQWHPEFFHTIEDDLINADILFESFLTHC